MDPINLKFGFSPASVVRKPAEALGRELPTLADSATHAAQNITGPNAADVLAANALASRPNLPVPTTVTERLAQVRRALPSNHPVHQQSPAGHAATRHPSRWGNGFNNAFDNYGGY